MGAGSVLFYGSYGRGKCPMPMVINEGDRLVLRKKHPCGGNTFTVERAGMDFRLRCETCGSRLQIARRKLEKSITGRITEEHN